MSDIKVLVLVGSLRAASINRQIAELAAEVGAGRRNRDRLRPAGRPAVLQRGHRQRGRRAPRRSAALRAAAAEADAALVVTPEYNGSIPAVLKNAIDWLSRPFGDGALKDKPLAVIGGPLGQYGGVWAHDETRKSFGIAGPRVVEAIKLSVPFGALDGQAPAGERRGGRNVRDVWASWSPKSADPGCAASGSHAARGALLCRCGRHVVSVPSGRPRCMPPRHHFVIYDTPEPLRREGLRPGNFMNVVQNILYLF